jgi:RNA polymerase sigma factor (sigma-70 family)
MEELTGLITRARHGDGEAFGSIVRRFQDMAVGYGYSLLKDFQSAEDAAQEAFLEAYLKLDSLREPAAFPGWFRRIVFKQCDRIMRGPQPQIASVELANEQPSTEMGQDKNLEQVELQQTILTAIETLPEHERTTVTLFYLSGHSHQEISAFLDVPTTTIKKRLYSARGRLRDVLVDVVADALREYRPSRTEKFSDSVMEILSAARSGDTKRVEELLRKDRRLLSARDWLGNTALIMAVNSGQHAVAELLFRAGVEPDIHEAAATGDLTRVKELLTKDPNQLDCFSKQGFTPLGLAAHFGHVETTQFLLNSGADPSIVSLHPIQVTPLHAALFGRRVQTSRLLIECGSNVNAKRGGKGWPRSGWTPLHYVAGFGLTELVHPLLSRKADINATDDEGRAPLRVALDEGQTEVAVALQEYGATEE